MASKAGRMGVFIVISLCMGFLAGVVIWALLYGMNLGIDFVWTTLPGWVDWKWLPLPVCAVGGLAVGLWRKKHGDYPEELSTVLGKVRRDGGYPYDKLLVIGVAALLPLIFGGSLGPEAGLTGFIAGLCTAIGVKFKKVFRGMRELPMMGLIAALGVIFREPLFGLIFPVEPTTEEEGEYKVPKRSKVVVYTAGVLGAMGAYVLLSVLVGSAMSLGHFDDVTIRWTEVLALLPLAAVGVLGGVWYHASTKLAHRLAAPLVRKGRTVTLAVVGGLVLGLCGVLLPYSMFAGEHQMTQIMGEWQIMGVGLLIATCFVKLLLTNLCLASGWKGGNIFPVIFSGISLGYAMAILGSGLGLSPHYCVAIVSAALTGTVMRKPVAVALLLLLCFPLNALLPMLAAAFIGGAIPLPKRLLSAHGDNQVAEQAQA